MSVVTSVKELLRYALLAADFSLFTEQDFERLEAAGLDNALLLSRAPDLALDKALSGQSRLIPILRSAFSSSGGVLQKERSRCQIPATRRLRSQAEDASKLRAHRRAAHIRKDYEELYTELLHLYEQGDGAEPALVDIIPEGDDNQHDIQSRRFWTLYLGNPGTGKSLAGLVLLFLFVKKGVTVVYYMQHKLCPGAYLLFQKGKLISVLDFGEAIQYLVDPSVIYIHDGGELTGTGFIKAATLLIASPNDPKVYKEFVKVSGGYAIFYGRLWSMEELQVCWRMVYWGRLSWDSVLSNIYYVGRIPRLAFVAPDQFKPVREAVKGEISTTAGLLQLLSLVGQHIDKTFSNQLLHLDREKDPLSIYTRIASEYVIEQLLLRLPAEQWCQAVLKYKNLPGVTALAELRGSIMELLMHLTFPKFLSFGERICDGVHGGEASHFDAGELRVFYYSSFDDLLEKIKVCRTVKHRLVYFWPRMKTEAAIDSIYIDFVTGTAYLLQSTLSSKRHLVVWSPVKKLCSYFSSEGIYVAGLYFVTSPSNYAGFKCQGWKKSRAVRDEYESLQKMPRLCQYKVRFKMHAEDLENIPKLTMFERGIHANLKALAGWTYNTPEKHVRSQGVISEEEHMSKRPRLPAEQGSQLPRLRKACQSSYFDDSFFDTDDKFIQEDVEDAVSSDHHCVCKCSGSWGTNSERCDAKS